MVGTGRDGKPHRFSHHERLYFPSYSISSTSSPASLSCQLSFSGRLDPFHDQPVRQLRVGAGDEFGDAPGREVEVLLDVLHLHLALAASDDVALADLARNL